MSSAPDRRDTLDEIIGPTDDLARTLRERIARAEAFLRDSRALLETIEGGKSEHGLRDRNRYRNVLPETAMLEFLGEAYRTVTKEELVEELLSGNVKVGSTRMTPEARRGNIRRSIEAQVLAGKIKRLNDRLGLPDWPEDKFKS